MAKVDYLGETKTKSKFLQSAPPPRPPEAHEGQIKNTKKYLMFVDLVYLSKAGRVKCLQSNKCKMKD
jgi:hypothetical protein